MTDGKRILVVDDSELILEAAKEALRAAGYTVETAHDLEQIDQIEGEDASPDLILMDVQMPELFGDDVGMILRNVRGVSSRIYLFSSLDKAVLEERAAEAGLDGYICKSDGIAAMVAQVDALLGEKSAVG